MAIKHGVGELTSQDRTTAVASNKLKAQNNAFTSFCQCKGMNRHKALLTTLKLPKLAIFTLFTKQTL